MKKGKGSTGAGGQESGGTGEQEGRGAGEQKGRGTGSIIFLWTSFQMTFIIWLVSNLQLLSDQIMNRKEIKK